MPVHSDKRGCDGRQVDLDPGGVESNPRARARYWLVPGLERKSLGERFARYLFAFDQSRISPSLVSDQAQTRARSRSVSGKYYVH